MYVCMYVEPYKYEKSLRNKIFYLSELHVNRFKIFIFTFFERHNIFPSIFFQIFFSLFSVSPFPRTNRFSFLFLFFPLILRYFCVLLASRLYEMIVLYCIVLYCIVLYCILLYCIVLYCILKCLIIQDYVIVISCLHVCVCVCVCVCVNVCPI